MTGRESLISALRRRLWGEDRPLYWIHGYWAWGWTGNGWNRLALGKVSVYFANGPSPLARLRLELIRPARIRVANRISGHVNHYEAEFPLSAPPAVLTHEWLDETEIKLREGLGDRFVDDACAVMLAMVGHCRALMEKPRAQRQAWKGPDVDAAHAMHESFLGDSDA